MTRLPATARKGRPLIDHIVKPDLVAPGNRMISLLAGKALLKSKSNGVNLVPTSVLPQSG